MDVDPPQDEDGDDSTARSGSPPLDRDLPETSPATTNDHKVVLALHTRLADVYQDSFYVKQKKLLHWERNTTVPFPLLCVDPDLDGTWLCPPPKVQDDTYGFWANDVKLPPPKTRLTPPDAEHKYMKRPSYYHVVDEPLKALFGAGIKEKIFLPPNLFDKSSVSVSSPHALLDVHLQSSLLENFTVDAYMPILSDLINCAAGTSSTVSPSEALSLMPEVARQVSIANARQAQSITSAYVGNMVLLRDHILDKFVVPPRTRDILRGSDFSTESLFGPLPEHFATLLDTSHGSEYRCKSKWSGSTTKPTSSPAVPIKRPNHTGGLPRAKHVAPNPKAPRGKGRTTPFHRGAAGRGSKSGRS